MQSEKTKAIRTAATTAMAGNAVLAILKIVAGSMSSSTALVGDGIDSAGDVLISLITLAVVKIISKPADVGHPWGHRRAETIAAAFLAFTIFYMGVQLIISSVLIFLSGEQHAAPSFFAVAVTLVSIAAKILLAASQHVLGKRSDSAMIKANAKNMASDVFISAGVLVGLVISYIAGHGIADTVIAILIGLWIIKTAVGIFFEANLELMDGHNDLEPYRVIAEAVKSVEEAANPHRARMRRIANFWDIDLDIEVDPRFTVHEAHRIATRLEKEIKNRLENVFDIMIHVEPYGDTATETFGLSEDEMTAQP